ncbi:hypothetical protein [Paraferrimonas haliotis]|uniref:Uncharacterized protein n=1 Tax=Paraferrimonas haliotis TaxID=2013866 RepID=A0AA37TRZ7_9GAMM|nr:hypothetical protein [Paraferrimonas haliotis]GLS83202.1 hypothetical protein GCM10007894_11790 [Paraferrimonas haliotis]
MSKPDKPKSDLPEKWQAGQRAAKATQVAFDLDEQFQHHIRREALDAGLSPSDQIRSILGLSVNRRPKRPRLTLTLNPGDYEELAKKYQLDPNDQLEIKKQVLADLIRYVEKN